MATEEAADLKTVAVAVSDKYRSFLHEEGKSFEWRHGGPPTYDAVNKVFEDGRTKEWPKGSLEEVVQNAVKSWEMELSHKTRIQDFRTLNPDKFKLIVNGKEGLSGKETLEMGSYNALLKSSMPEEFKVYKSEEESFESSHDVFRSAFPRGFAWEVISVFSGPPVITFKFRHWGFFEGPFKAHAPTGEMVQFFGVAVMKTYWVPRLQNLHTVMFRHWGFFEGPFKAHAPTGDMIQFFGVAVMKVDEALRAEDVEVYYDPGELFAGLIKGPAILSGDSTTSSRACPFHK